MPTELGQLLRRTRTDLRLTLQGLAQRIGYRNLNKGARRLETLEVSGLGTAEIVRRAASALGIDPQAVFEARARDEAARSADFEGWLDVAQPMEVCGYVAGVTFRVPLPPGLTEEQAIAFATDAHRRWRVRMCLVLDRKRSFWISPEGKTYLTQARRDQPNSPYSTMG
jgi:transcriptional regulator with XRE-family HTH domain